MWQERGQPHGWRPQYAEVESARFAKGVFNRLGMVRDHCQENARWPVWPCSSLFPVPDCRGSESESRGKPRLAEAEAAPDGRHVDRSSVIYLDVGDAESWNVLASGVCEGLVQAGKKGAARGCTLRRPFLGLGVGLFCHSGYFLLPCSCLIAAIVLRAAFFSAADRFVF